MKHAQNIHVIVASRYEESGVYEIRKDHFDLNPVKINSSNEAVQIELF